MAAMLLGFLVWTTLVNGNKVTTTDAGISPSGISVDAEHSFMIQLYDNYLEVDVTIESNGQELLYAVIVTEEDCVSKYKFVSLDSMLGIIRDAIDDDGDKSMTSYSLKVIGRDKLELNVLYDVNTRKTKFILHSLKRQGLKQEVKLVNHMQRQIYDLKSKIKILKGMMVPKKGIIMYSECDKIPKGYTLCDGKNGVPDLRDQFVLNADEICDSETCIADTNEKETGSETVYSLCYIMRK